MTSVNVRKNYSGVKAVGVPAIIFAALAAAAITSVDVYPLTFNLGEKIKS